MLRAALVLGVLRLVGLSSWSLWLDEAYTLSDARHGEDILNPFGYWLMERFYDLAAGRPSELVLRLPSALLGWLCIPLSAWVLRGYVGRRAAAFAALFVALSPWHLYWSQNARFYTLAQAACLVGCALVHGGLRRGSSWRLALGLIALAVASGAHPSSVLLAGAVCAVPWLLRWASLWPRALTTETEPDEGRGRAGDREPERARAAWYALAVLCVVVLGAGSVWGLEVLENWRERHGDGGNPLTLVRNAGYLMSPGLGVAFLIGALTIVPRRRELRTEALLLATVLLGLSAAVVMGVFVRVSAQYVFVLFPLVAGVAAVPFRCAGGAGLTRARATLLALVVLVPFALETTIYFTLRNGDRPQWREAYAYVFEHRSASDLVLGMDAPVGEYYWNPLSDDLRELRTLVPLDAWRANVPRDWARYERSVWFVVNDEQLFDWPEDDRRDIRRILDERCTLEASFLVPWHPRDLDVRVYRSKRD